MLSWRAATAVQLITRSSRSTCCLGEQSAHGTRDRGAINRSTCCLGEQLQQLQPSATDGRDQHRSTCCLGEQLQLPKAECLAMRGTVAHAVLESSYSGSAPVGASRRRDRSTCCLGEQLQRAVLWANRRDRSTCKSVRPVRCISACTVAHAVLESSYRDLYARPDAGLPDRSTCCLGEQLQQTSATSTPGVAGNRSTCCLGEQLQRGADTAGGFGGP